MRKTFLVLFVLAQLFIASRAAQAQVRVATFPRPNIGVDLYGFVQPRLTVQQSDTRPLINLEPNPAFTLLRTRLGAIGYFSKWGKMQLEVELGREVAQPIDAFIVLTPYRSKPFTIDMTLGQFRVPISRQNLIQGKGHQLPDPAYFVTPRFILDRDIGAMLTTRFLSDRVTLQLGMFNGNEPGRGQIINADPHFLYAARLQAQPLGVAPNFEGDVRPLSERHRPVFTLAGSFVSNQQDDKHFLRRYVSADAGVWWHGASLYGEFYYHVDQPVTTAGPNVTTEVRQMGWNVQAGYFPPLPFTRQHLEIVGRVHYIDPNIGVEKPANDNGARDLDQSNPTWGYTGYVVGLNLFLDRGHDLKVQASYEIRNETKRCLEGQSGDGCTGFIKNDIFQLQATAAF